MSDAKTCPQCGKMYGADDRFCTVDGAALIAAPGASIIGTVLAERFLVLEKLGEGGMGEVYLAEHVRMKRKVALKLMRPWMLGDPVAVGRFHREAENASQISHPNVAAVYDFGETAERVVYLAMEFVDGEPLSNILKREGRLHVVRAAEIVRQVAEALVAAHGMGILHRDLKPDNVMVARSRYGTDVVKLVDFGIARAMNRQTQQFTSTGLVVGTPDYMSPEQLSGDELDGRSDLYALALIAYRMLTGGSAYSESSSGESLVSRLTGKPKRLESLHPDVTWPEGLQAAFDRALAPDPAERFPDPMEFVAELDAAVMQMPLGEAEQAYMTALSQRHPTPARGGLILDGGTPTQGIGAIRAPTPTAAMAGIPASTETPTTPLPATTVRVVTRDEPEPAPPAAPVAAPTGGRPRWVMPAAVGGLVAVAAIAWVATRPEAPPATPNQVVQSAPDSATLLPAPTPPVPPATATTPAAAAGDSAALVAARRATLAAWPGDRARGGATVLVDASGLALAPASLVAADSSIHVFMDPNTRVQATVLAVDKASGVATLLLPMRRCPRCAPLAVDAASPAVGDSVLVLPAAGRDDGPPVHAAVTAVSGGTLTLSDPLRSVQGAPVVSRRSGQVLGLVDGGKVIGQSALGDAVTRGKRLASGRSAADVLVPIWPQRQVPRAEVSDDATAAIKTRLASYQVGQKDVVVLAMTPALMQWRVDEAANPMNLTADRDPIGRWASWKATVAERRAVVVFNASHKDATFGNWPQKPANLRNADAATIRLFRGDSLVAPIEAARFPALTANGDRPIPTAALASYSALEFREGSTWRVEVADAQGRTILNAPVPAGTLEAIRRDFGWLFR